MEPTLDFKSINFKRRRYSQSNIKILEIYKKQNKKRFLYFQIIKKMELPETIISELNDLKWSTLLNKRQENALCSGVLFYIQCLLKKKKNYFFQSFGVPWTVLNYSDCKTITYFGSDRWQLILQRIMGQNNTQTKWVL